MTDLSDAAYVIASVGVGFIIAAAASYAAERSERRKWRNARKRLPYILE